MQIFGSGLCLGTLLGPECRRYRIRRLVDLNARGRIFDERRGLESAEFGSIGQEPFDRWRLWRFRGWLFRPSCERIGEDVCEHVLVSSYAVQKDKTRRKLTLLPKWPFLEI